MRSLSPEYRQMLEAVIKESFGEVPRERDGTRCTDDTAKTLSIP